MDIFSTRNVLERGVIAHNDGELMDDPQAMGAEAKKLAHVSHANSYYRGDEYHLKEANAIAYAVRVRDQKIESLKADLKRLESLEFTVRHV